MTLSLYFHVASCRITVDVVHVPKDCYKEQPAFSTGILNSHWLQTYLGLVLLVKGYEYFLIQMDSRTSWTLAKPLASPDGTFIVSYTSIPVISFRLAGGAAFRSYVTVQGHTHNSGLAINSQH